MSPQPGYGKAGAATPHRSDSTVYPASQGASPESPASAGGNSGVDSEDDPQPSGRYCPGSSVSASLYEQALPVIPTLAVTSPNNYGRYDAENESNIRLIASVPHENRKRRTRLPSMLDEDLASVKSRRFEDMQDGSRSRSHSHSQSPHSRIRTISPLLTIPSEIIDTILSYLATRDLVTVSSTCHVLRQHALADFHWQRCVQRNVPKQILNSPGPFTSYRNLYVAYDRVWFLPKYKIWFCDRDLMGKLLVVRYDQRRGCIEGYQLLSASNKSTLEQWAADSEVIIHGFEPVTKLHLDKPVLRFHVQDRQEEDGSVSEAYRQFSTRPGANRFTDEMPMSLDERNSGIFSNFLLTRPLDPVAADEKLGTDYPYDNIWPPPTIPARCHVSGARSGRGVVDLSPSDRPRVRSEVCDQTFRIRRWMEMAGSPASPSLEGRAGGWAGMVQRLAGLNTASDLPAAAPLGIHIGDEIITYSTLDPILYTPTPLKPWRGIWVGDYSGHGCEFLLINQPDDPPASDVDLDLIRGVSETSEEWEQRRADARMYRGRLEAIKLTGDPNIPRGEYTFIADDLGPQGYVGIATDPPFTGARVVKSKGHIAATGFVRDKFIESQLILIGPNKLAQYWVGFGHISYFVRIDIDSFLAP